MIQITNNTRAGLGFVTGVKDGEPVVVEVLPGETKNVDVKPDDVVVQARVHAQAITVGTTKAVRRPPTEQ